VRAASEERGLRSIQSRCFDGSSGSRVAGRRRLVSSQRTWRQVVRGDEDKVRVTGMALRLTAAVDQSGPGIEVMVSARRDAAPERRFFQGFSPRLKVIRWSRYRRGPRSTRLWSRIGADRVAFSERPATHGSRLDHKPPQAPTQTDVDLERIETRQVVIAGSRLHAETPSRELRDSRRSPPYGACGRGVQTSWRAAV